MKVNKKLTAGIALIATLSYALYRRKQSETHTATVE